MSPSSRAVRPLLLALAFAAALVAPAPARAEPVAGPERVRLAEDATLLAPGDLARERTSLGARGDMMTLTDGNDVLVVVVYRSTARSSGAGGEPGRAGEVRAPSADEARRVHAAELARALGTTPEPSQTRALKLLGKARATTRFTVTPEGGPVPTLAREGWVVAAEKDGRTVVAAALHLVDSPNARPFEAIVESLTLAPAAPK